VRLISRNLQDVIENPRRRRGRIVEDKGSEEDLEMIVTDREGNTEKGRRTPTGVLIAARPIAAFGSFVCWNFMRAAFTKSCWSEVKFREPPYRIESAGED
jgi:hypothetical protein